jgi:BirA family biotin operon repressor/biotin-[acetyl-CoA-carboxylase] ligase
MSLIDDLENREFMKEYRSRSLVLGKSIRFIDGSQRGGRSQEGIVEDIDDNGGLIIRTREGERTSLNSGEITIRTL